MEVVVVVVMVEDNLKETLWKEEDAKVEVLERSLNSK